MGLKRTDEFRADAVRIALTSGLARKQVASDLGVGLSTLNKWVTAHRDTDSGIRQRSRPCRENERLRRENRILKEEREILKKGETIFRHWSERMPEPMRFRFIEEHRDAFYTKHMCDVLDVSSRGLRAHCSRPASQRQRTDMVILAHIKEQSRLSLGSYGRPRMTEKLKELGLNIGHRRIGRLLREKGIRVGRSKKYKATTIARQAIAKQSAERETAITPLISRPTY